MYGIRCVLYMYNVYIYIYLNLRLFISKCMKNFKN